MVYIPWSNAFCDKEFPIRIHEIWEAADIGLKFCEFLNVSLHDILHISALPRPVLSRKHRMILEPGILLRKPEEFLMINNFFRIPIAKEEPELTLRPCCNEIVDHCTNWPNPTPPSNEQNGVF